MIDRNFIRRMRAKHCPETIGSFLADSPVLLAVFHSRELGRDYILARDQDALRALTENDRAIPVILFQDCEHLAGLSAADIGAVLDVKLALGPEIELREVRPARLLQ